MWILVNRKYIIRLMILPPLFFSLLLLLSATGREVRVEECDGGGGGCWSICWILKQTGGQQQHENDSPKILTDTVKETVTRFWSFFFFYKHKLWREKCGSLTSPNTDVCQKNVASTMLIVGSGHVDLLWSMHVWICALEQETIAHYG